MISADSQQPLVPYQPFIDGLRAIAVTAVVAYHAGVPGLVGGFIGVDIFFVISGYLIISQIIGGLQRGSFTFKTFWARRALRILPSYLLVILVTCAIAPVVLVLPSEFEDFGAQVLWSSLMLVNHYFLEQQGYFDTAADLKPLLHLWSLAVEEQFYVVAPIVLVILATISGRFGTITSRVLTAIMFAVSLALCVWLTTAFEDKNYSFYVMPLRAWEFIAGGAVGLLVPYFRRSPRWIAEAISFSSVISIVILVFYIDSSMPFPSYVAVGPVIATTALIAAGTAHPNLATTRMLSLRPMVGVGLISYAWYLWHWPLMAFARIYNFEQLPLSWGIAMAAVSLFLATGTYLLIEKPIKNWRHRTKIDRTWRPMTIGGSAIASIAAAGALIAGAVTTHVQASLPEWTVFEGNYPRSDCTLNYQESAEACLQKADGRPIVLLMGDSHARALWQTAELLAAQNDYQLATLIGSGCIGLFDVKKFDRRGRHIRANCVKEFERGKALLTELRPEAAIIASRWLSYSGGVASSRRQTLAPAHASKPEADQKSFFIGALAETVDYLAQSGAQRTIIMGPTPEISPSPPNCILRADHYNQDRALRCSQPSQQVRESREEALERLATAVENNGSARVLDPYDIFCSTETCLPYINGNNDVLYRDTNHYNRLGAKVVLEAFQEDINWLFHLDH